jgi:hypothetical protein
MTQKSLPLHLTLRRLTVAAALCAAAAANATITFVSSAATAPFSTASKDTFSDLAINSMLPDLAITRSLGSFRYTLGTTFGDTANSGLYVVPAAGTGAVSTGWYADSLVFTLLSSNVLGFGGNFFGTNILGEVASGGMRITVTDTAGTSLTQTIAGGALTSFAGFVSDVPLRLVTVSITTPNTGVWASADNILITSAVPEPSSWILLLAGTAALRLRAQRRG